MEYALSGLGFLVGNIASEVIGVTFNRALRRLDECLTANPAAYFNDSALSFTNSGVTLAAFSDAQKGDFPE